MSQKSGREETAPGMRQDMPTMAMGAGVGVGGGGSSALMPGILEGVALGGLGWWSD